MSDKGRLHHHKINGALIACYHVCRHRWYLWIPLGLISGQLLDLSNTPLEHWLWTDVIGWDFDDH